MQCIARKIPFSQFRECSGAPDILICLRQHVYQQVDKISWCPEAWVRMETVPPPSKFQAFATQPGPQRALKFLYHVHIVYLLCMYSLPCPPFACVPPSGTRTRHVCGHVTVSGTVCPLPATISPLPHARHRSPQLPHRMPSLPPFTAPLVPRGHVTGVTAMTCPIANLTTMPHDDTCLAHDARVPAHPRTWTSPTLSCPRPPSM